MHTRFLAIVSMMTAISMAGHAMAQDVDAMIKDALMAAPESIAKSASIMSHDGKVLRKGNNGFTCFPGVSGAAGPMCLDQAWLAFGGSWMAGKKDFKNNAFGIGYMLAGDRDGGASNINPFDKSPTADNQWVSEGPHLMIIVPDNVALADQSMEANNGGPYVMWKGTNYEHLMVPIGPRTN